MDVFTTRIAVFALALCAVSCVVAATVLTAMGREIPLMLATVAGLCVGGLAGALPGVPGKPS